MYLDGLISALKTLRLRDDHFKERVFLANALIDLKQSKFPHWCENQSGDALLFGERGISFLLRRAWIAREESGYYLYTLTMFENFRQIISYSESDSHYDQLSERRAVIDLYDVLTSGAPRVLPPVQVEENDP